MSRLRALETGRTVVIASVNGRSGFIAPDGTVGAGIEPRTRTVLARDVPLVRGVPPSMWVGPWLGRVAALVALGAVLWALLPYALQLIFSDGHDRGIYPWVWLRELSATAEAAHRSAG